ncbi:MAG: ATP-binding protein [Candidatus Margulisbacteria bacterium]|nr:ATP-binding protein [Candidatus Margulisiibacteriota bacterium]
MFEVILSSMRDGAIVLDNADQIIFANQSFLDAFSLSRGDVVGKRLLEAVRIPELAGLAGEARAADTPIEKEITVVYPEEKIFSCSAAVIETEEGEPEVIAMIFHDISEMKKLENLRSEFVANVSHELKTPLTAIRGYVETLLDGAIDDPENNKGFLQKIDKNAQSLSALIDDLLQLSSLEARRGIKPFTDIDVSQVIVRAMETLSGKLKTKEIEIVGLENCPVTGDENLLYRALLNLIDNAVNYSSPGSKVEIACRRGEKAVEISIKDYGIGIAAEHLPRLFERFYRVDKARSRDQGGTGLGLAIVKHIMEIHGGSVRVESEEGKGSKFTLIFPI